MPAFLTRFPVYLTYIESCPGIVAISEIVPPLINQTEDNMLYPDNYYNDLLVFKSRGFLDSGWKLWDVCIQCWKNPVSVEKYMEKS